MGKYIFNSISERLFLVVNINSDKLVVKNGIR